MKWSNLIMYVTDGLYSLASNSIDQLFVRVTGLPRPLR